MTCFPKTSYTNIVEDSVLINIEKLLMQTEISNDEAVCVYRVPKSLSSAKPEAFTPQFLGLGPYHHSSPEVYAIEKSKVAKAKKKVNDFSIYTENLRKSNFALTIRDCYDSRIAFKDDTLLHLMTVDAFFLYELLHCSLEIKGQGVATVTLTQLMRNISISIQKRGMPLVNAAGVELTVDAIIRDVFMLENQIPTCILKSIVTEISLKKSEIHVPFDENLGSAMLDFCTALCPFPTNNSIPVKPVHLLDLMYHLIVPVTEPKPESEVVIQSQLGKLESLAWELVSVVGLLFSTLLTLLPVFGSVLLRRRWPKPEPKTESESQPLIESETEKLASDRRKILILTMQYVAYLMLAYLLVFFIVGYMVKYILKQFLWVLNSFAGLSVKLAARGSPELEKFHAFLTKLNVPIFKPFTACIGTARDSLKYIHEFANSDRDARRAEAIPSATELNKAGIHFHPANGGISSIEFDEENCKFYLPCIRLDVNSEVIMRNLVAYESLIKSEYLIFTRYIELMSAIMGTAKDVKLLVREKIIETKLSDEVVAQLFSWISKSIRPTKTPILDKEIEKVHMTFDSAQKGFKVIVIAKYVFSVEFFIFLGVLCFWL